MNTHIRNVAIIAHVDHGKTTLVDKLLREGGAFRSNQVVEERVMDSMDLEREKGITIKAKNASIHWHGVTINIVDTPGHADFGGEVERILGMVDGVLLLVDAYDGPQAQTRFVLRKALEHHLKPIVVINKIDRDHSYPMKVHDKVLELFLELNATEAQFNAPFLYASARDGIAVNHLDEPRENMIPLLDAIVKHIPPPEGDPAAPFQMLISNLDWSDYVGRIAIGRISGGQVHDGDNIVCIHGDGKRERATITKIFQFSGIGSTADSVDGEAGNIVGIAGFEELSIGETLCASEEMAALPFVELDPPTIQMDFCVNDGPLGGRDGKYVTSRYLRDRLIKETRTNISLTVADTEVAGVFRVSARGTMQIAVLAEQMRREGFEMLVSRPTVIVRIVDGKRMEPYETLWIELPDECLGSVMKNLAERKSITTGLSKHHGMTTLESDIPTRGLIGFEFDLLNLTSGRGVMSHLFKSYAPWAGEFSARPGASLVSMEAGVCTHYTLANLKDRGRLFVGPGDEVYEGMIVGANPRPDDILVNPTKAKHLTNVRCQGEGKSVQLEPPTRFTVERALEYIAADEYVEVTPCALRLRKKILNETQRRRAAMSGKTGVE